MKVLPLTFKLISLILLLGSFLTLLLTLITGGTEDSALGKFYWLQTDCSKYPGSPIQGQCRWTYYHLCGVASNGKNTNCVKSKPAYPFSPRDNFSSRDKIPASFLNDRNKYFFMSRIGWAFAIIGLFFLFCAVLPFITYILFGGRFGWIFWILYGLSFLFTVIGVALSTAVFTSGKNVFGHANNKASLGARILSTAWITIGCFIVNLFVIAYIRVSRGGKASDDYIPPVYQEAEPAVTEKKPGFFKRTFGRKEKYPVDDAAALQADGLSAENAVGGQRFTDTVSGDGSLGAANSRGHYSLNSKTENAPQYTSYMPSEQYEQQVQDVMRKLEQEKAAAAAAPQ
ncbi:DEKNAAC102368 [Brettanomyces naardenensis]|uniref:DEKNAAC102368 n=1 Tax=Brettanomyces naardenensis TaxID=13370 RepID=A0A448YLB1_BRENA|nr:DEKNAAC102368 [Brettanomyces naardenensis]